MELFLLGLGVGLAFALPVGAVVGILFAFILTSDQEQPK